MVVVAPPRKRGEADLSLLDERDVFEEQREHAPALGTWAATGSMKRTRNSHAAEMLADGRVLVMGGAQNTAELYDPASGTWTETGSMKTDRLAPLAVKPYDLLFELPKMRSRLLESIVHRFASTARRHVQAARMTTGFVITVQAFWFVFKKIG